MPPFVLPEPRLLTYGDISPAVAAYSVTRYSVTRMLSHLKPALMFPSVINTRPPVSALSVACPMCKATADQACVRYRNGRRQSKVLALPHPQRVEAAALITEARNALCEP